MSWFAALPPAYAQLLGLGVLLILGHCSGMCGPLILSFRFGLHQQHQRGRMLAAAGQVFSYQVGRIVIYGLAGAVTGRYWWDSG